MGVQAGIQLSNCDGSQSEQGLRDLMACGSLLTLLHALVTLMLLVAVLLNKKMKQRQRQR